MMVAQEQIPCRRGVASRWESICGQHTSWGPPDPGDTGNRAADGSGMLDDLRESDNPAP